MRKERQTLQWNHNSLYIYVGNYFSNVRHQTAQSTMKKGLVSTVLGFPGGKIYKNIKYCSATINDILQHSPV